MIGIYSVLGFQSHESGDDAHGTCGSALTNNLNNSFLIQVQLNGIGISAGLISTTTLEIFEEYLCDCVFVIIFATGIYFIINCLKIFKRNGFSYEWTCFHLYLQVI